MANFARVIRCKKQQDKKREETARKKGLIRQLGKLLLALDREELFIEMEVARANAHHRKFAHVRALQKIAQLRSRSEDLRGRIEKRFAQAGRRLVARQAKREQQVIRRMNSELRERFSNPVRLDKSLGNAALYQFYSDTSSIPPDIQLMTKEEHEEERKWSHLDRDAPPTLEQQLQLRKSLLGFRLSAGRLRSIQDANSR